MFFVAQSFFVTEPRFSFPFSPRRPTSLPRAFLGIFPFSTIMGRRLVEPRALPPALSSSTYFRSVSPPLSIVDKAASCLVVPSLPPSSLGSPLNSEWSYPFPFWLFLVFYRLFFSFLSGSPQWRLVPQIDGAVPIRDLPPRVGHHVDA